MPTITTKDGTEIFYKDWGSGQPIVFSHGWPLSADDWDAQLLFFLHHGYRVIAHDRRTSSRGARARRLWSGGRRGKLTTVLACCNGAFGATYLDEMRLIAL